MCLAWFRKSKNLLFTFEGQPTVNQTEIMPRQHYSNAEFIAEPADTRKQTVTDLSGKPPLEILRRM